MKISTNKKELIELGACDDGLNTFIKAHGDSEVLFSQCLGSNGWNDVFWLLVEVRNQLSDNQNQDLRDYACQRALINIEKIKLYCSKDNYNSIVNYLNNPTGAAISAAKSAAISTAKSAAISAPDSTVWSAARSAWLAAESAATAKSAAWAARAAKGAARSAWSATESAARLAVEDKNTKDLRSLFLKWESQNET